MISIILLFIHFLYLNDTIPEHLKTLMKHYPQIKSYRDGKLIFKDNSSILYDDKKEKSHTELLDNSDIEDMFAYKYPSEFPTSSIIKNHDPGRIRNDQFFKKIYGTTKAEVEKNLVEINWCPKLVNQKIKVTKVNGVSDKIIAISNELDQHPEFKKYIEHIGGTFNWRKINGTNRMSLHSYGMTIDINIKYSDNWQWQSNSTNENINLTYRNRIPKEIVEIFEKHGFIWGGKWYHYDTMHFEYRPELL
jgi:hypothetical protein